VSTSFTAGLTAMPTTIARHEGEMGSWEMVSREPHPALRPHVRRYCGYVEDTLAPMSRVEAAVAEIPVIVSLGPRIEVDGGEFGSFVAGLSEMPARTEHDGHQLGIQIDLSPLAARMLLGTPMHELAGRVVALEDVLGARLPRLIERLQEAPTWDARFDLLDGLLARRLAGAPSPPPSLVYAWQRLRDSHGRARVGALAAEVGCSPRYLTLQFRDHLGMPPKPLARILRFRHALDLLECDDGSRYAEIAEGCGYYDQAHLNRDFRAFAGAAPGHFLARRLPDGGGVAAEKFASVQDGQAEAA
jgi:AraC-like DNA-binding protein